MMDVARLDDLVGSSFGDLRRDGKACPGKRTTVGDDEGVDANQFTVSVDERAAGVAWTVATA